jgi:DNA-binding MarR family transcriptional regulator
MRGTRVNHRAIYKTIEEFPGCTVSEIARKVGETRERIVSALPSMESSGLLTYEDDNDRLYPFAVVECDNGIRNESR